MSAPTHSPSATGGTSADVFLHVQAKRAGKIKGEAANPGHVDDITVLSWQWGMRSNSAVGSAQASERRSYTALTIHKHIDLATTALMSALVTNDEIKEARLTVRRAGGEQEDYFIVVLSNARISSVEHNTDSDGHPRETVAIVFTKVDVEYRPQKTTGLRGGSTSFNDEIYAS